MSKVHQRNSTIRVKRILWCYELNIGDCRHICFCFIWLARPKPVCLSSFWWIYLPLLLAYSLVSTSRSCIYLVHAFIFCFSVRNTFLIKKDAKIWRIILVHEQYLQGWLCRIKYWCYRRERDCRIGICYNITCPYIKRDFFFPYDKESCLCRLYGISDIATYWNQFNHFLLNFNLLRRIDKYQC